MRISEARGGKMREVNDAVSAGKSYLEIQEETGVSRLAIDRYRSKGVDVPYLSLASGKEYQENLRFLAAGLLDDRQILAIFEDIEKHNRDRVCQRLREAGVLVPLGKTARNVGVFIHESEPMVYRLLKDLGIPVVSIESQFTDKNGKRQARHYYFVLNNHERTIGALAHPSFDAFRTNPVVVLGRVPNEIPTTNIMWDNTYISVGKLLREKRIPIPENQGRKYLDPDCPVTVFYISGNGSLYVREKDSDALARYLNAKLASLPRA